MANKFVGIDVGTTGTKTIISEDGKVLGKGYKGYGLITPFVGAFEQDGNAWYDAVVESVRTAIGQAGADGIKAVSVSAQGGSFFPARLLDGAKPLCNAFTWMDVRAEKEFEYLKTIISPQDFYKITGWRLSPSSMICKVLWLKNNIPELFDCAEIFFTTSDYVYYKLTGKMVIDYTSAAMTGLYDITTSDWNDTLLTAVGLDRNKLPTLTKCGTIIGEILPEECKKLGLNNNTILVCGAHDQYCASIGTGTVGKDDILISTGTTWVVFGKGEKLKFTDSFIAPCSHPDGGYGLISSAVSSGTVMEWLKTQLDLPYKEIDDGVENSSPNKNLLFYPFVSGCGEYRQDKNITAGIVGFDFGHNKFDIVRSAMEGVAFEIKLILSEFAKAEINPSKIIVAGGATASAPWMKILSAVLGKNLLLTEEKDLCPLGALKIAQKAMNGCYDNNNLRVKEVVCDENLKEFYQSKYLIYRQNENKVKKI